MKWHVRGDLTCHKAELEYPTPVVQKWRMKGGGRNHRHRDDNEKDNQCEDYPNGVEGSSQASETDIQGFSARLRSKNASVASSEDGCNDGKRNSILPRTLVPD